MDDLLGSFLGSLWGPSDRRLRQRREKLRALGMVPCRVRVVAGRQEGLGKRWRSGIATLHPGIAEFEPQVGGSVFSRTGQKSVHITVLRARRGRERTPTGWDKWASNPYAPRAVLRTPNAVLEFEFSEARERNWTLDRLNGAGAN